MPFNVSIENDKGIFQVLKHYHINPQQQQQQQQYDSTIQWTIIDTGLPSESILFAKSGYYVFRIWGTTRGDSTGTKCNGEAVTNQLARPYHLVPYSLGEYIECYNVHVQCLGF
jgi:hypothetical protein